MARFETHPKQKLAVYLFLVSRLGDLSTSAIGNIGISCRRRCEAISAIPRQGKPLGVATPVNERVVGIIYARERRMLASWSLK
jgi:hypothetical protein